MVNELLWILLILINFTGIILAYRFFGKTALYSWMAMSIIIANIQVMKTIKLFGLVASLGNIIYATSFLVTDILQENYGKKEAKKAIWIGFFSLVTTAVIMQVCLLFIPYASDNVSMALQNIFGILPRITLASLAAYILSQYHDVWAFQFWKGIFKGKHLWIRNNLPTITSQLIDNIIFTWIAFVGLFGLFGWKQIFSWNIIIQIFIVSYVTKFIVSFCDIPFLYWSRIIKKKYNL